MIGKNCYEFLQKIGAVPLYYSFNNRIRDVQCPEPHKEHVFLHCIAGSVTGHMAEPFLHLEKNLLAKVFF